MMIVGGILIALVLLIGIYVATSWAPELTVEELRPRFASPSSAFVNVAGMKVHMRDEGPRYDPESTDSAFVEMVQLFRKVLGGSR